MPATPKTGADLAALSLLETLQSSAPFGFGFVGLDWRYIRVNPALAAMNGLPVDEHPGRLVADVVPQIWEQVQPVLEHLVATGDDELTQEFAGPSPSAPNRTGSWLNTFYPVRDDGQLIGIGFVVLDVTERRRSEQLHSVIMESIVEGLVALDADGCLTCMNAAAEQMLGYSEHELRGQDAHERLGIHRHAPAVRSAPDGFVCRDGRILPVHCSITPDCDGGLVIVFRDGNEETERRRRAERELDAVDWVRRVREALEEDRLELYSQSILPLAGGAAREELLLRMITRDGVVVSAGAFMPAVETFGLIGDIDRWVIRRAMRYAAEGRIVQINVSAASTGDLRLLNLIAYEMRAAGAPPANVIFELTETALMSNAAAGEAFATGLRAIGAAASRSTTSGPATAASPTSSACPSRR